MADRTQHSSVPHGDGKCHCNDPLTQVPLDLMVAGGCSVPGCPCGNKMEATGFYFSQQCCEGAGFDIRYFQGVLWITCHNCEHPVTKVAVAKA